MILFEGWRFSIQTISPIYFNSYRSNKGAGIAIAYGLDDRGVEFESRAVPSGAGDHPAFYPIGRGGSFAGG
jgi:hypothetical protein